MSVTESTPRLLKRLGIMPKKSLGQSFLTSPSISQAIARAADLKQDDVVIEIGPGLGILTAALAETGALVIAVELDERLVAYLRETFAHNPRLYLVHGDILDLPPAQLLKMASAGPPYKLVANIPYYITSAVLRHFLESPPRPTLIVMTMQKEVARRIASRPPDMNLLALSVQLFGKPEIVMEIGPGAFYPPPKVTSAVVRVVVPDRPPYAVTDYALLFTIARACFQQARKKAAGTISRALGIPRNQVDGILSNLGLDIQVRPQEIPIEAWAQLAEGMKKLLSERGPTPR